MVASFSSIASLPRVSCLPGQQEGKPGLLFAKHHLLSHHKRARAARKASLHLPKPSLSATVTETPDSATMSSPVMPMSTLPSPTYLPPEGRAGLVSAEGRPGEARLRCPRDVLRDVGGREEDERDRHIGHVAHVHA